MTRMLQRVLGGKSQSKRTSRKNSRSASLRVEGLETRTMMSLTGVLPIQIHSPVVPINLTVDTFSDGNLASPAQTKGAPDNYTSNPIGSPWLFAGQSGVSGNGSNFTAGNPDVPVGTQVAFLQKNGTMSQSFYLSQGTYSISFQAAQRQNAQSQFQAFEVWVDNTLVDLVVPATTGYTSYHSINFTVTGTGLHTLEFKGVDPLAADDTAFITKVQINGAAATADPNEPTVLAQAVTDFHRDGSLTYGDMLGLFNTVVAEVPAVVTYHDGTGKGSVFSQGGLTTPQLQWLQTIVDDAATFNMPADVSGLASNVVNGNPANATYQSLGTGGAVVSVPLGNVVAATTANNYLGSPATQVQDLVNKWFLGEDYPATSYGYAPASGTLFGSGGSPLYSDVYQGGLNDCWLMASLEEAALKTPAVLESMIQPEGNGIWTVRFYANGTPTYVTVNDELPGGGYDYTHPAPDRALWAALAEKAYAEVFGNNNYGNVNHDGFSQGPLAQITGRSVWDTSFYLSFLGVMESNGTVTSENHLASQIYQAFESGQLVTLGSNGNGTDGLVCGNHMYALIGASESDGAYSFTLGNPWGPNGGRSSSEANYYPGTVSDLSENTLFSNFDYVAYTQGTGPASAASSESTGITGIIAGGAFGAGADGSANTAVQDAAISDLVHPGQSVAVRLDSYGLAVLSPRPSRRIGHSSRDLARETPLGRPTLHMPGAGTVVRQERPARISGVQAQPLEMI
jgi:hypothetical protein